MAVQSTDNAVFADVRDVTLIAGVAPYAYKGTNHIHRPHLRPSGQGGCAGQGGKD